MGPDAIQFRPQNEQQALAFSKALDIAYENRTDMGYPWMDAVGTLEISVADAAGTNDALIAQTDPAFSSVSTKVTAAGASVATLDRIGDAVTRLATAGVPHADLIYKTEPDQKNNRVIITVSELNDDLMAALASRFGTAVIAVRVAGPKPNAGSGSRSSDGPPFWGGAKVYTPSATCTTGFAWNVGGGVSGMLTAAHCAPNGASSVSYPSYANVGTIRSGYEENWATGVGTQYYTGQSTYRGDVALIRYSSSYSSAAKIYTGGPGSSTSAWVAAMDSRWAQLGDAVCVGGQTTGEWCGMVTLTGANINYIADGPNVWARHVSEADAAGNTCPTHGDSGAPVYQKRSDGKVTAFGIYSGGVPLVVACETFFTDIWDAYYGLPGTLKTG